MNKIREGCPWIITIDSAEMPWHSEHGPYMPPDSVNATNIQYPLSWWLDDEHLGHTKDLTPPEDYLEALRVLQLKRKNGELF